MRGKPSPRGQASPEHARNTSGPVTQRDEKEQRQQKPLFLLAVGCNAEIAAICDDAVGSLEGIGFRGFTDPDEALVWAKDHGLLGVVIDNEMPRMDGAAFLRRLPVVADQPRPHIILLTEGAADEVPAAARKAGIDDIVVKPVPRADFAAFLASALALRFDEQMGWQPDPLRPPVADVPPPSLPPPIVPPLPPPPAPPEPASSRRRAVLWLAIALLLLLLFVGCSLYRRAATGADAGAAPTTAGSPVLDTPQGAALSGSAPTAAGTSAPGDLRTPPPSSTTPSMSAPARGRAPAAESPLSAGESGSRAIVFDPPLAGGYGQGDGSPGSSAAGAPPKPGGPGDSAKPIGGGGSLASGSPNGAGAHGAAVPVAGGAAGMGASHPSAAQAAAAAAAAKAAGKSLPGADGAGFLVLDSAGNSVAESQPDVARAPASTIKVLTAAAALATLGADARFRTEFIADGPIRAGVLDGPLVLVGGGDPVLRSADLDAGVAALVKLGVRRVRGDLLIDASAFTGAEHNSHWTAANRGFSYGAGTSAVSLDEGTRIATVNGAPVLQPVADQAAYMGAVLGSSLRAHHIALDGTIRSGRSPGGTVLWQHESPPVSTLVRTMLVESDNHIAEQLLRAIGRAGSGVGSEAAGIAMVRSYLAERGVSAAGLALYDGSGLSLDDRATPRMLATLLWRLRGTPEGDLIHASLPPIGNTAAQTSADASGMIRAKTGNVGAVRGLVGSVDRQPGDALSFAFLDTAYADAAFLARRKDEEDTLHQLASAVP